MKNKRFLLGMFSVLLTFGLLVTGCDNSNDSNDSSGGGGGGGIPSELLGTWIKADATIIFFADNVNVTKGSNPKDYSVDVNGKTIKYGNGGETSSWATLCTNYTISGTQLTLSGNAEYNGASPLNGTYTKQ
jgi:hypothetical protein